MKPGGTAAPPSPPRGGGGAAVRPPRRRHDEPADETAEYDADDHDDDRGDDARDVTHKLRENVGERLETERVRGNEHHSKHHEPEDDTARNARRIHPRTRPLHCLHHAATLEDLVEMDTAHQSIGSLLQQSREKIAGKENDERAEERGHIAIELLEASLQSLTESECRRGVH